MNDLTLQELGALMEQARKKARERMGKVVSREQVGEVIGVNQHTVYEWEKGKQHPGFLNVVKFCDFLGITLDDLLGVKKKAGI